MISRETIAIVKDLLGPLAKREIIPPEEFTDVMDLLRHGVERRDEFDSLRVISITTTAALLDVSQKTIERMFEAGDLTKLYMPSGAVRVRLAQVRELVTAQAGNAKKCQEESEKI